MVKQSLQILYSPAEPLLYRSVCCTVYQGPWDNLKDYLKPWFWIFFNIVLFSTLQYIQSGLWIHFVYTLFLLQSFDNSSGPLNHIIKSVFDKFFALTFEIWLQNIRICRVKYDGPESLVCMKNIQNWLLHYIQLILKGRFYRLTFILYSSVLAIM